METPVEIQPEQSTNPQDQKDTIPVLDKGFVRLVDVMGEDHSIVQAARVSYGTGTKSVNADRGLIHYLMKHQHTTPFEMVEFKFHCKMPIFVARQWIRHRTANVNEISGRYSIIQDEFWEPTVDDLRSQSKTNRQGSTDSMLDDTTAKALQKIFIDDQKDIYAHYEKSLEEGVAREIARINLPLSIYTEWYWKIDLHNLFHFLRLRLDSHAQKEIRVFAEAMAVFVKSYCPLAWEAFEEYQLNGKSLSRSECSLLSELISENNLTKKIIERRTKQLKTDGASEAKIKRELTELTTKLCLDLNKT